MHFFAYKGTTVGIWEFGFSFEWYAETSYSVFSPGFTFNWQFGCWYGAVGVNFP